MKKSFMRIVGSVVCYLGKFAEYVGSKMVKFGGWATVAGISMKCDLRVKSLAAMFKNDFIFTKPMITKGGCETQTGVFRRSDCL